MDMPPSRYKVVEEGRRLVVVDRLTGAPVTRSEPARQERSPAPRHEPPMSSAPQQMPIQNGAAATMTTQAWFDNKAPRQIRLGENGQSGLIFAAVVLLFFASVFYVFFGLPGLFVGVVILANIRKGVRGGITKWLDGLEV